MKATLNKVCGRDYQDVDQTLSITLLSPFHLIVTPYPCLYLHLSISCRLEFQRIEHVANPNPNLSISPSPSLTLNL
jgi:hypothetical protein